jgi:fatty-acid desaturase
MRLPSSFVHDRTFTQPIVWITTLVMVAFHIGALVALFLFSWKALLLALVLWWVAGSLGIEMGYHRLLTHRGYKTAKWVEYFLTICGTLALEGGPIFWVATHRMHHQNTDKEGDPHSPRDGGLWAHMGWILTGRTIQNNAPDLLPYVPDLRKTASTCGSAGGTGCPSPPWARSFSLSVGGNSFCGASSSVRSLAYIPHGW